MKPGNRKGRPNYPIEFKRRLATAACEAGVTVSKLSMANGVNTNMVFKWRREYRAGLLDDMPETGATMLSVVLADTSLMVAPATAPAPTTASSAVEIIFADAVVRAHEGVDAALLRTIFQSLRP